MGLTFLTPLMLAGAVLVAAPIVLHMMMRQQPKHFVFPALRFIRQRNDANKRRLKLRHILLLLLRCGVIVLLALALARPSLQSAGLLGDQEAPVAAALVFDTSPRMQYRHQNQTRLEVAQEAAERVMTKLPP
ncbi:MAG TPA: BatA domain-containing protein, partial [Pirellulales bacterium]